MKDFHDDFRKMPGSFDAACEAVRTLKKCGTIVRIAMSVTPDNINQVRDVFYLCKQLGADAFATGIITSFGRGSKFGMCAEKDHKLQHHLSEILAPFHDDPLFDSTKFTLEHMKKTKEINCGAGWRSFGLNGVTGEVRSCLFLADSKKFGSVDKQPFGEIFKSEYMQMFRNAPSPSRELETCKSCKYIVTCQGCFAKAFRVSETDYPECPWRKKYFPEMQLSVPQYENGLPRNHP